jgi:hypothetical protein
MMGYQVIEDNLREHISIDKNSEGAFRLTALVHDPNDTFNLDLDPFYKTTCFYLYDSVDEAIEVYIQDVYDMGYVFVEEDDEWMMS